MTREPNYLDIKAGDEIFIGPFKGVRFWTYQFPSCVITSFQHHDIKWSPGQVAVSDGVPTIKNGRGLNVYITEADALRESADAINGVIADIGRGVGGWSWIDNKSGIVLGKVEFWGKAAEYDFGHRAKYVKPTRFLRAWGYEPELVVSKLNTLWFGA